jgi:hypothetical protein
LLGVLQALCCHVEHAERDQSVLDVPSAVGVHPDVTAGAERVADGRDAVGVRGEGPGDVGDLHLRGAAAGAPDEILGAVRRHGGHDGVDRHVVADRRRPSHPGRLESRGQPVGGHVVAVLRERTEVAPSARPLDEHPLTNGDAPELLRHRQRVDMQRGRPYLRDADEL